MTSKTASVSLKTKLDSMQPLPSAGTPKRQPTPRRFSRRTTPRTPCDRYIPNRTSEDVEFSRFQVATPSRLTLKSSENLNSNSSTPPGSSCCSKGQKQSMRECLLALKGQSSENRVLSFHPQENTTPKCEYYILSALQNVTLESVIALGYLLSRMYLMCVLYR